MLIEATQLKVRMAVRALGPFLRSNNLLLRTLNENVVTSNGIKPLVNIER